MSDKLVIIIVASIIGSILLIFHFGVVAPQLAYDNALTDKWKKEDQVASNQTKIEQQKLKTMTCSELKTAIGNNEFTYLNQQANNQYLGRCT